MRDRSFFSCGQGKEVSNNLPGLNNDRFELRFCKNEPFWTKETQGECVCKKGARAGAAQFAHQCHERLHRGKRLIAFARKKVSESPLRSWKISSGRSSPPRRKQEVSGYKQTLIDFENAVASVSR